VKSPGHRKPKTKAKKKPSPQRELPRFPKNLQATVERIVEFQSTIAAYNPDLPAIFSTPAMIGLMEVAAAKAIQEYLSPGTISVGTRIEIEHRKSVPQGAPVQAHARLIGTRGRFLVFEAETRSKDLLIGRGKVYRAIVPMPEPEALPLSKRMRN
jgi:fluoroacetyl-CoA thioesterase